MPRLTNLRIGVPLFIVSFLTFAGLLFLGALLVQGGGNGEDDVNEGAAIPDQQASDGTPAEDGAAATQVEITGRNIQFDKRSLTLAANMDVTVVFHNQDAGVLHNVAIYRTRAASERVFVGEIFTGPDTREYGFRSPAPGSYFYRCDVHPDTMTGTLTTR